MKKLAALLLSLLLAVTCFACGKREGGDNPPDPGGEEEWTVPEGAKSYSDKILYTRKTATVTGAAAAVDTRQWGMGSTDLGIPFYDSSLGRLYLAFGDSYAGAEMAGEWNNNVILYTDDTDVTGGIKWAGALDGMNGKRRQITPVVGGSEVSAGATTCIPTGAIVTGGNYYMFYMEVGHFNGTIWDVYRNRVMKSADRGKTWTIVPGLEWTVKGPDPENAAGNAPNFGQIFPIEADDYVYLYGLEGGRNGGAKLARVKKADIESKDEYEYFVRKDADNNPTFVKGDRGLALVKNSDASVVIDPACGEMCVTYNPYLQRYLATYLQGTNIVMRQSKTPWGEWSSAETIVTNADYPGIYGGFTHPVMSTHNGKRIYIMVSQWLPIYNVSLVEVVFA